MANAVLGQVAYEPIQVWNVASGAGFPVMDRELESACLLYTSDAADE